MAPDPLDAPASPARLYGLAAQGHLSPAALDKALSLAGVIPDKRSWHRFISRMLLFLGAAFVLAGVIFFFAYNWAAMGRFLKFGLVEAGIVAAAAMAWHRGLDSLVGKVSLLVAAALVGPLLAVYGQVYQTGADPYGLFLAWAVFVVGWVVISAFPALWLLLLVLLNTAVILFWKQVLDPYGESVAMFEALFALNAAALAAWEWLAWPRVAWLKGRWIPRLVACAILVYLVMPTIIVIFDYSGIDDPKVFAVLAPILYIAAMLGGYWHYTARRRDLFMLAACMLSAVIVVTSLLGHVLGDVLDLGDVTFLVLAVSVMAQSAASGAWLRRISSHWGRDSGDGAR